MLLWVGLVNLSIIFFIIFFIIRNISQEPLKPYFLPALTLKFSAGIALGLIYKYYYGGGDTFNMFHDANQLAELASNNPHRYISLLFNPELPPGLADTLIYSNQDRALLASKILSVFSLLTSNNYWLAGMYWSLFSFVGMWYLANVLSKKFPQNSMPAIIGFLFFPSVVFWSSGILKESLIMGALCFLVAFFIQSTSDVKRISFLKIVLSVIFLFLLWKLKYYYLAVLLPVLAATFFTLLAIRKYEKIKKSSGFIILIWLAGFALILILSTTLYPTLSFNVVLHYLVQTHDTIFVLSKPENLIYFYDLRPDLSSIIINFPLALFSGLYRPTLWDATTFFQWLAAIENFLILICSLWALKNFKKINDPQHLLLLDALIIYIIILAAFMAFSSPNFGTLMRYKIGYLPFLVYLVLSNNPIFKKLSPTGRS
ncbi:hypothetical protein BH23BAC1_BH23BAC1_33890 [soil metagenome]